MNNAKFYPYKSMGDGELIDITIKEMDRLKLLEKAGYFEQWKRKLTTVDLLIQEIKRRKLYIEKPFLIKRIFDEK